MLEPDSNAAWLQEQVPGTELNCWDTMVDNTPESQGGEGLRQRPGRQWEGF